MTTSRIAVVTGATQGLGLALAEGLAHRMDPDDLVLLTGRDPGRVAAAVHAISGAKAKVRGRVLDVTDTAAVDALAGQLGSVDIVFSNASARMTPERTPAEQVDLLVETNNLGAIRMLTSFEPILRSGGRLIVVASSFGTLGQLDPRVRAPFGEARTLKDVEVALAAWRRSVHDGTAAAQGWPHWLNVPSKVAQVAAVRAVAAGRHEQDLAEGTLIAAVCPGLIDTDASRPWFADMSQAQTPAQAAEALLDLALAPRVDPGFHGELVRFGQILPWAANRTTREVGPRRRGRADLPCTSVDQGQGRSRPSQGRTASERPSADAPA